MSQWDVNQTKVNFFMIYRFFFVCDEIFVTFLLFHLKRSIYDMNSKILHFNSFKTILINQQIDEFRLETYRKQLFHLLCLSFFALRKFSLLIPVWERCELLESFQMRMSNKKQAFCGLVTVAVANRKEFFMLEKAMELRSLFRTCVWDDGEEMCAVSPKGTHVLCISYTRCLMTIFLINTSFEFSSVNFIFLHFFSRLTVKRQIIKTFYEPFNLFIILLRDLHLSCLVSCEL